MPLMRPTAVGYGAGQADPEHWPNALRIFIGDSAQQYEGTDTIVQIETNVDDLHPQAYETVMERVFAAGAVDATLTPVIMKHERPGIVFTVLAPPAKAHAVAQIVLRDTSTLGVRMQEVQRLVLSRRMEVVQTLYGPIRMKVADLGSGKAKAAPEYQDCKRIAEQTGRPVREILEEAAVAYRSTRGHSHRHKGRGKKKR
jgi:uncharacterized protein (DUF111 family)